MHLHVYNVLVVVKAFCEFRKCASTLHVQSPSQCDGQPLSLPPLIQCMSPLSYRPRPSSVVTVFARSFRTTTGVGRRAAGVKQYKLDRQWELSRKPAQRWSIFHGLRIRIRGVVSLFRDDKELQAWRTMYVRNAAV
jgi:hypothetical protein